jgi:carbonic anhydrase
MSAQHKTGQLPDHPHRRSFLQASSAITAMALVGTGTLSSIAYADALNKAQRDSLTPDGAMYNLETGVVDFLAG